jgi:hypothetical protein
MEHKNGEMSICSHVDKALTGADHLVEKLEEQGDKNSEKNVFESFCIRKLV